MDLLKSLTKAATQEKARRNLADFTQWTFARYKADPAHRLIADHLDRLLAGDIRRLMISAPPQHGKSELASVRLPAFWLAKRPDDPIIIASYAASLAHAKSRHARNVVESTQFSELFPDVATDPTSRAVDHWELKNPNRGAVKAAGVGGPITGHGAALGIIDDPFENWEQAQSKNQRRKIVEWYKGTFRTRIWEDGAIVIIMTRWHEDDLIGTLLKEQGELWTMLRLPALAEKPDVRKRNNRKNKQNPNKPDPLNREPGAALCPSRFSSTELVKIQTDVGPDVWSAEYQAAPEKPGGNRFKRAWFADQFVDAAPRACRRIRYWDFAATEGGGAQTAGVLVAVDDVNQIYVEDAVVGHWATNERNGIMKTTAQLDALRYPGQSVQVKFEQEPGSSGIDAAKAIIGLMIGFPVSADKVTGSKDVRLDPLVAQCAAKNVFLVRGEWNESFIAELCAIPNGTYRDQGDAASGALNGLAGSMVQIGVIDD